MRYKSKDCDYTFGFAKNARLNRQRGKCLKCHEDGDGIRIYLKGERRQSLEICYGCLIEYLLYRRKLTDAAERAVERIEANREKLRGMTMEDMLKVSNTGIGLIERDEDGLSPEVLDAIKEEKTQPEQDNDGDRTVPDVRE